MGKIATCQHHEVFNRVKSVIPSFPTLGTFDNIVLQVSLLLSTRGNIFDWGKAAGEKILPTLHKNFFEPPYCAPTPLLYHPPPRVFGPKREVQRGVGGSMGFPPLPPFRTSIFFKYKHIRCFFELKTFSPFVIISFYPVTTESEAKNGVSSSGPKVSRCDTQKSHNCRDGTNWNFLIVIDGITMTEWAAQKKIPKKKQRRKCGRALQRDREKC